MKARLLVTTIALSLMIPAPGGIALPSGTKVETYRAGLDFPVDMAWVPGTKKIFFTEKNSGRIRVMVGRKLLSRPCTTLDVESTGERGALGIALHPRFKKNRKLYVYYTNASPLDNRVTRFTVRDNRCGSARHIITGIDASSSGYHNGGQIEFAGGKLFVATGEAHRPAEAESTSNVLGKVLRLNPDGSIPTGNPFSTAAEPNPVWSYGHRNPFGLAARPGTTRLYGSENGPQCDDELNRIYKGRNYGWGAGYDCGSSGVGDRPVAPMVRWTPPIVPTDLAWYRGRLKAFSGSLLMGDFGNGNLHRFRLNDRGDKVVARAVVHTSEGGIVDVAKGPGGWLYFLTPDGIFRVVRA